MKKIVILTLILSTFIFAKDKLQKNWTIILSTTKNLENAETFVKKNIKNLNHNIYIFKERNKYRVTYGAFNSYMQAKRFLAKQPHKIKRSRPFISKRKYNLENTSTIPSLAKVIMKNKRNTFMKSKNSASRNSIMANSYDKKQRLKNWTIVLKVTKRKSEAYTFINQYIKEPANNIAILKDKNRYLVTYGSFGTFQNTKKFLNKNRSSFANNKSYIWRNKYNLKNIYNPNLVNKKDNSIFKEPAKKEIPKKLIEHTQSKLTQNNTDTQSTAKYEMLSQKQENVNNNNKTDLDYTISLKYSPTTLSGDMKVSNGTKANLKSDLGLGDSSNSIEASLLVQLNKHILTFGFHYNKFSGSNKLNQDLFIPGSPDNTFTNNSTVNSSFKDTWIYGGYRYNILPSYFLGGDLHSYNNKINISNNKDSTTIENDYLFATLNADAKHNFSLVNLNYGLSIGSGSALSYSSYYLGVGSDLPFINNADVSLGYQSKELDIKDSLYEGVSTYKGIYVDFRKKF